MTVGSSSRTPTDLPQDFHAAARPELNEVPHPCSFSSVPRTGENLLLIPYQSRKVQSGRIPKGAAGCTTDERLATRSWSVGQPRYRGLGV